MPSRVLASRLANQHLGRATDATPATLVAWFGAVQAQEYGPARWAIGQRGRGLSDARVARAFDAGEILRTHVMRPTWHFVAPEDLRWLQALTGPRVRAASASVLRANGLDARVLSRSRTAITRALEGGRFLTRQELSEALGRARIPAKGQRLAYIVMDAELEALICSGPRKGKQFTYALVDERVPAAEMKTGDEALGELTRRYFQSHGPATVRDFVWWSGLRVPEARRGIDIAKLTTVREGDLTCFTTGAPKRSSRARASAHLLPIYDEYVNAYRDRAALFASTPPKPDAVFMHYLIVDGGLAGTWRTTGASDVEVCPHRPLSEAQHTSVRQAVSRYQKFMGGV